MCPACGGKLSGLMMGFLAYRVNCLLSYDSEWNSRSEPLFANLGKMFYIT